MARILLVEDDTNLREIYAARLEGEGYEVSAAADGEEALAEAVKVRPDLIILDVMMPKISGFDVLDILRSTPETKDSKVIMMTALSQDSDKDRGEKLGTDRYLIKSQVTLEDVVSNVKELLNSGRAADPTSAPADTAAEPTLAASFPGHNPTNNTNADDTTATQTQPTAASQPATAVNKPVAKTAAAASSGLIIEEPKETAPTDSPASTGQTVPQSDDNDVAPQADDSVPAPEEKTEKATVDIPAPASEESSADSSSTSAPKPVEMPPEPNITDANGEDETTDNPITPPAPEEDNSSTVEPTTDTPPSPDEPPTATAAAPGTEKAKPPVIEPLGEAPAPLLQADKDDETDINSPRPGETINPTANVEQSPSEEDNDNEPPIRPHEIAL